MRLCLLFILTLLHFIFIPFFTYVFFLSIVLPFCSCILILKITLLFLIYVLLLSTFFTFISDLPSCIISCHYSWLCLFPTSFFFSCRRSFAILSQFQVSLSLQIVLFFISFFIIYGPASFFARLQNSKGHWLSHCTIKGASCAEFQPHLFYHILLNFCFIFVIVSLYLFCFIHSLSPLVYFAYFRLIFFLSLLVTSHRYLFFIPIYSSCCVFLSWANSI